jgi:hypothetical protein
MAFTSIGAQRKIIFENVVAAAVMTWNLFSQIAFNCKNVCFAKIRRLLVRKRFVRTELCSKTLSVVTDDSSPF